MNLPKAFWNFIYFSVESMPIVLVGWANLARTGSLYLYNFWNKKFNLDKLFFILLFLQFLFSGFSWFQYNVNFLDIQETVYIHPKWNFFFILVTMLNFFFLGFWNSAWIRIWFFSTQILMIILLLWGYLEPSRYYFDFIDEKEIKYTLAFYGFILLTLLTFVFGFLTFQEEDRIYELG